MKINILKEQMPEKAGKFIKQKAGYAHIYDRHTEKYSYMRRLTKNFYPRLHMYIKESNDMITFNLHLDQKKSSYLRILPTPR